jgi:hypothetical protein
VLLTTCWRLCDGQRWSNRGHDIDVMYIGEIEKCRASGAVKSASQFVDMPVSSFGGGYADQLGQVASRGAQAIILVKM